MDVINSKTKREKEIQELGESLRKSVDDLLKIDDLAGYALVVWTSDFCTAANWDSEYSTIPGAVIPEFVKQAIQTRLDRKTINEILDDRVE